MDSDSRRGYQRGLCGSRRRGPRLGHTCLGGNVMQTIDSTTTVPGTSDEMTFSWTATRARRRRPDHMKRACTLLACGWCLQSRGTEGFVGTAGGVASFGERAWATPYGPAQQQSRPASLQARAPHEASHGGWQRRPRRRTLSWGSVPGSANSCTLRRVKASPTLDLEGGAPVDEEDTSSLSHNGSSSSSSIELDLNVDMDSSAVEDGLGSRRKPQKKSARGNRILELLNGLEGGGGFDDDANEFFEMSAAGWEGEDEEEDSDADGRVMVVPPVATIDLRGLPGEEEEDQEEVLIMPAAVTPAPPASVGGDVGRAVPVWRRLDRKQRRAVQRRQPPLTRSQAEEEKVYPLTNVIRDLVQDKNNNARCFEEVLDIMAQVREEHGDRGLGLTYIYQVGMLACETFKEHRETLRLFHELKSYRHSLPSRQIYDVAILAHCFLHERDEAVEVLYEMHSLGFEAMPETYQHILHSCAGTEGGVEVAQGVLKVFLAEEGSNFADGMPPPHPGIIESYMTVLSKTGRADKAVDLFWRLEKRADPPPDAACCEAALKACRRAGNWREALAIFRYVRREDVRTELTNTMYVSTIKTVLADSRSCLTAEEADVSMRVAMSLYDEMRHMRFFETMRPRRQASLLHAIFSTCMQWEAYWPRAIETFDFMRQRARECEDNNALAPRDHEYRSMLHVLSQRKDTERGANWERSVQLLRDAVALNHRVADIQFHTVIVDLGYARQVDLAFEVFAEMTDAGIPYSVHSYNRLLSVCEKSGEVERTFKLLDDMYKAGLPPDVVSFGCSISACGKGYEWRKALALLVRMQHDNISPNLHCMNAAINALGLSGEWQRAEQMMEVIVQWGLEPNVITYNSLAMAYASAGESDHAFGVLDTIFEKGIEPDEITFGTLLTACDVEDAYHSIRSLMDQMDRLGIPKTVIHYCAAIDSANRVRETATAWELWRLMKVNGVQANNHAYSSIINTAAIDRDVRTALRLLEEMEKKEIAIDVVTYTTAICACGPDWLLALDVLEDMAADGVPPNLQSYTAAMCSCIAGEEYREGIIVFNRMKEAGIAPDLRAYNLAILAHERDGDFSGRRAIEAELHDSDVQRYELDWDARW